MITIVDYGMGNLRSVRRAFEHWGCDVQVTCEPGIVALAEKIVLPGVGAFGEAVKRIDTLALRQPLLDAVHSGTLLLGICLGMQLLFDSSEESPGAKGLGILEGNVKRFDAGLKVPHIGWNDVLPVRSSPLFGNSIDAQEDSFYFVHSYYIHSPASEIAATEYGVRFSSAVQAKNITGVQFHPEKSQSAGLALLKTFVEM
jgi:glutamine amidotransferase